mmetsp:Transcript_37524/g.60799  ORF Transcript_37524/g.60799 Transcript_37524/m.60799 type:complete len:170 (-) Transcript_37524:232-741(-)
MPSADLLSFPDIAYRSAGEIGLLAALGRYKAFSAPIMNRLNPQSISGAGKPTFCKDVMMADFCTLIVSKLSGEPSGFPVITRQIKNRSNERPSWKGNIKRMQNRRYALKCVSYCIFVLLAHLPSTSSRPLSSRAANSAPLAPENKRNQTLRCPSKRSTRRPDVLRLRVR